MQRDAKFFIRLLSIVLLFLIIAGYTIFELRKYYDGPIINIQSPKNGATENDSLIEIIGQAENIKSITMNDRPILIDLDGNIDEKLLLYPGVNTIKFEAEDKFGQKKIQFLTLFYGNFTANSLQSDNGY